MHPPSTELHRCIYSPCAWLALLLVRIVETTTAATWPNVRRELQRLHVGTFTGPAGTFRQRTELTKPQQDLYTKLQLTPPKAIIELTTPTPPGATVS